MDLQLVYCVQILLPTALHVQNYTFVQTVLMVLYFIPTNAASQTHMWTQQIPVA
jgi:hypothetical protein